MKDGKIATKLVSDTIPKGTGTIYTTIGSCSLNHDGIVDTSYVEEMFLAATSIAQQAAYTIVDVRDGSLTVTTRQLNGLVLDQFTITSAGDASDCLPGDADSNGRVDVYDALLILQSLAGWDVEISSANADANEDGVVNIDDALRVLELCFSGDMSRAARALQAMLRSMSINSLQIEKQPTDQYAVIGQRAQFAVAATGDGLTHQWHINRNDSNGWRKLKGATSAIYVTAAIEKDAAGYQYRCVITDVYGNELTSDTAVLHVVLELPNTGDASEPLLYALAMILAGVVLLCVWTKKHV